MPQRKYMRIRDYVNQIPDAAAISTAQTTTIGSAAVGFLSWLGSINWVGLISVLVAVAGLITNVYFSWRKNKREEELHQFTLKIKSGCSDEKP
ncbi:hypothetical protein HMPREF3144_06430 [Oligella sp. HMSC05A10]|nr:hypothetical protein HMPREF3144_06430 [Oligella sp. HMSC05A10]OFV50034.1 hypothetical protein HMPREF3179_02950 [Oligella sp. HMSC09E12]